MNQTDQINISAAFECPDALPGASLKQKTYFENYCQEHYDQGVQYASKIVETTSFKNLIKPKLQAYVDQLGPEELELLSNGKMSDFHGLSEEIFDQFFSPSSKPIEYQDLIQHQLEGHKDKIEMAGSQASRQAAMKEINRYIKTALMTLADERQALILNSGSPIKLHAAASNRDVDVLNNLINEMYDSNDLGHLGDALVRFNQKAKKAKLDCTQLSQSILMQIKAALDGLEPLRLPEEPEVLIKKEPEDGPRTSQKKS